MTTSLRRAVLLACAACAVSAGCVGGGPGPEGPVTTSWRQVGVDGAPAPRWGEAATDDGSGGAFLMGGTNSVSGGNGVSFDDVWHVDADGELRRIDGAGAPVGRYCHCIAYAATTDQLVAVGGIPLADTDFRETWILDDASDANRARWRQSAPETPPGSMGCSSTYDPATDAVYLFGGLDREGDFDDHMYRLDVGSGVWTDLGDGGPFKRYDPELKAMADGTLLLVAGAHNALPEVYFADVWLYATRDNTWEQIYVEDDDAPPGRRMPWLTLNGREDAFLMGFGVKGFSPADDVLGDLVRFDLDERRYTPVEVEGGPGPRGFVRRLPCGTDCAGTVLYGYDLLSLPDDAWQLVIEEEGGAWH